MKSVEKKSHTPAELNVILESCVGCKWATRILGQIRAGVARPGALQRSLRGLTTKVMNERLQKLVRFGILEKQIFAESPPRVEYRLTPFGDRFLSILDQLEALRREHS